MTDAERRRRVEELCDAALNREVRERPAFVAAACGADDALRREVEALLAHAQTAEGFLAAPMGAVAAQVLADERGASLVGRRVGAYQILSLLGAGGMGEVYRARDTKLRRDVAIKILPRIFTSDPERLARFEREARLLATLNHPHIGAIYGVDESDGARALILELVEGPTLAEKLAHVSRGASQGSGLPLSDALAIGRQIAEALEAAHEKGIIHRDLKPANIKITADGSVKVLDFGLAKAAAGDASTPDLTQSPALTVGGTREGAILGTAAYMSPEQARGKPVDKRTDIWTFGCVLYEMLTGRPLFYGDTISDTIAAIIEREPDWRALPPETPPAIRKLLRRCLEKDPKRRVPDIVLARFEIDDALTVPESPRVEAVAPPGSIRPPDGKRIAYIGSAGQNQLYVRALDRLGATPFQGLVNPRTPFFSPDGAWVGIFDESSNLKKVGINSGPAITLSDVTGGARGASWGPEDTIIFATGDTGTGLLRLSASGGEPEVLTTPDQQKGELDHVYPEILPDGHAVLFTVTTADRTNPQIALLDLRNGAQKILVQGGSNPHYAASGHLVYGAAGALWAVPFDLARLEVLSDPKLVLERVVIKSSGAGNFALAQNGSLVYLAGDAPVGAPRTLVWVDRQGREDVIAAPPRAYTYPRPSPDGTKLAMVARDPVWDLWVWDFRHQTLTRLTFDPADQNYPVWTPDGRRIVFSWNSGNAENLYWRAADGTGAVERLTESRNQQRATAFSPDGAHLVFQQGGDLYVLSMNGERRAAPLMQTSFTELNADISADGQWIAYQSNESGQDQIYVRPFPDVNAGRWQVSTAGGTRPLWARSARELFYVAPSGALMRVPVEGGSTFTAGVPSRVLEGSGSYVGGTVGPFAGESGRTYDVSPDGQRFLMMKEGSLDQASSPPQLIVVLNWFEELKRLVPTAR